jgi:hypothetical protein
MNNGFTLKIEDTEFMATILPTLDIAEGAIEAHDAQMERLDELTQRLADGEFYVTVDGTVPAKCIDGRPGARGLAPNSAGGSESLMVADDLTTRAFVTDDDTTLSNYRTTLAALKGAGLAIGGHTDDHAQGVASGCGANDKLPLIYNFMVRNASEIRDLATAVGVSVSDQTHDLIIHNAEARSQFSSGIELLDALRQVGGDDVIDPLKGVHNEVVAVVNLRTGTTLNREALAHEFGAEYQAFNVDAWSFTAAAEAISSTPEEAEQKVVAMVYYNLATAGVLCGRGMRTIVLQ